MKEKIIDIFFEKEEWENLRPYIKAVGSLVIVSLIISLLFIFGI